MTSLLDNFKAPREKETSSLKLLTLSIRHFLNSRYQWFLIPVTIYRGYAQAFIVSDFTAVSINNNKTRISYAEWHYFISFILSNFYVHIAIKTLLFKTVGINC